MNELDEHLDLVDIDDKPIRTIRRGDRRNVSEGFFRSSDLFILRHDKILVPTRTLNTMIAPGGYDFSAGCHVSAGETYLEAIIRETYEELQVTVKNKDLTLIAKTVFESIGYIQSLYLFRLDRDIEIHPDKLELASVEWMRIDELLHAIDSGHPAKSNLKPSLKRLEAYLATD